MKNFLFRFKIQCIHIYNASKWYWHVKAHCPWVKYILRDDHLTKGFIFTSVHCSIQIICSNLQFHSDNKQAQTTWEGEQGDQVLRAGGRSHPPLPTGQLCLNFVLCWNFKVIWCYFSRRLIVVVDAPTPSRLFPCKVLERPVAPRHRPFHQVGLSQSQSRLWKSFFRNILYSIWLTFRKATLFGQWNCNCQLSK